MVFVVVFNALFIVFIVILIVVDFLVLWFALPFCSIGFKLSVDFNLNFVHCLKCASS